MTYREMTYQDLDMSASKDSIDCQIVKVEDRGCVTTHYIFGHNRDHAIELLTRTGWFINSCRNIVE